MTLGQQEEAIGIDMAERLFEEMASESGRRMPHDIHIYRAMFLQHVAPLPRAMVPDVRFYIRGAGDLMTRGEIIDMCAKLYATHDDLQSEA